MTCCATFASIVGISCTSLRKSYTFRRKFESSSPPLLGRPLASLSYILTVVHSWHMLATRCYPRAIRNLPTRSQKSVRSRYHLETGWYPDAGTTQGTYFCGCQTLLALCGHSSCCWQATDTSQRVLCRQHAIGIARCPSHLNHGVSRPPHRRKQTSLTPRSRVLEYSKFAFATPSLRCWKKLEPPSGFNATSAPLTSFCARRVALTLPQVLGLHSLP